MANSTTGDRLWSFTTATGGDIVDAGKVVIIRKVVFFPAAVDNDVAIQEYGPDGVARDAIVLKASPTTAEPQSLDFGITGRRLNGFNLSVIDAGILYVYLGTD